MTSHKQHETSMENTMSHHSPLPIFMHLTHLLLYTCIFIFTTNCKMFYEIHELQPAELCFFFFGLQFGFWIWIWIFGARAPSYSYSYTYIIYILVYFAVEQNINLYTVDQLNVYEQTNHCFYANNHLSRNFCVSILKGNRVHLIYAVLNFIFFLTST